MFLVISFYSNQLLVNWDYKPRLISGLRTCCKAYEGDQYSKAISGYEMDA